MMYATTIKNMYDEVIYTTIYDGTPGNWEDEYDSIFSLTVVPEPVVWKSFYQRPQALQPVQLAAQSSKFLTMEEADEFYDDMYKKEFEDEMTKKAVEKEDALMDKLKKEMEKMKEWENIPLPTESESFKIKREAAEKLLREEAENFRKKTIAEQQQGNVWGHRRNGGGKKGRRNIKTTTNEVAQARRALHRQQTRQARKAEEAARTAAFAANASVEPPPAQPKVSLDEDEVKMRKLILAKLEKPENVPLPPSPPDSPTVRPPPKTQTPASQKVCEEVCEEICVEVEDEGWETVKRKRTGIEVLADKDKIRQQLKRTKMCMSVSNGTTCPHGVNCRFAHSPDELSISDCFFGSRCKFVCCRNGVFSNTGNKPCQHRHPGETEDNYFKRTGLPDFRPKKAVPVKPEMSTENFPTLSKSTPVQAPSKWLKPPSIIAQKTLPPSEEEIQKSALPPSEEETVIRVPKELAIQAMELAIASGKKLIRVEIV